MENYCLAILLFSKDVFDRQATDIFSGDLSEFLEQLGLFSSDAGKEPRLQIISAELGLKGFKNLGLNAGQITFVLIRENPDKDGLSHLQGEKLPFDLNDLLQKDKDDHKDSDKNDKNEKK